MPICTTDTVKAGARVDGTEFDALIPGYIATAQALIEHACGVAAGEFDDPPDAGVSQCAAAIAVMLINNPQAGKDEFSPLLTSALLDSARTWS